MDEHTDSHSGQTTRAYEPPKLEVLGTLEQLTQTGGGSESDGGAENAPSGVIP